MLSKRTTRTTTPSTNALTRARFPPRVDAPNRQAAAPRENRKVEDGVVDCEITPQAATPRQTAGFGPTTLILLCLPLAAALLHNLPERLGGNAAAKQGECCGKRIHNVL